MSRSRSLLVLVPPSEAKAPGGTREVHDGPFDSVLGAARRDVRAAVRSLLAGATSRELERILHVRGPLLERARAAMTDVGSGEVRTLPAWQRYCGVVWTHLEPATLHVRQRRRLLVPSGLYGLSAGEDRIADYRLRMSVNLAPVGRLTDFWRTRTTEALAEYARGRTIVSLLPREHTASIDFVAVGQYCRVRQVEFREGHDGAAVGHDAKAVKGRFARHVLVNGADGLEEFSWRDWRVVPSTRGTTNLTVQRC